METEALTAIVGVVVTAVLGLGRGVATLVARRRRRRSFERGVAAYRAAVEASNFGASTLATAVRAECLALAAAMDGARSRADLVARIDEHASSGVAAHWLRALVDELAGTCADRGALVRVLTALAARGVLQLALEHELRRDGATPARVLRGNGRVGAYCDVLRRLHMPAATTCTVSRARLVVTDVSTDALAPPAFRAGATLGSQLCESHESENELALAIVRTWEPADAPAASASSPVTVWLRGEGAPRAMHLLGVTECDVTLAVLPSDAHLDAVGDALRALYNGAYAFALYARAGVVVGVVAAPRHAGEARGAVGAALERVCAGVGADRLARVFALADGAALAVVSVAASSQPSRRRTDDEGE
jgi:hypothetical protein